MRWILVEATDVVTDNTAMEAAAAIRIRSGRKAR
jgi:hypothetical protein